MKLNIQILIHQISNTFIYFIRLYSYNVSMIKFSYICVYYLCINVTILRTMYKYNF
jgi:hypothetical protein